MINPWYPYLPTSDWKQVASKCKKGEPHSAVKATVTGAEAKTSAKASPQKA